MQPKHSQLLGKYYRLDCQYGQVQWNFQRISRKSESFEQLFRKLKYWEQEENKIFWEDMFHFIQWLKGQICSEDKRITWKNSRRDKDIIICTSSIINSDFVLYQNIDIETVINITESAVYWYLANDFGIVNANLFKTIRESQLAKWSIKESQFVIGFIEIDRNDLVDKFGWVCSSSVDLHLWLFWYQVDCSWINSRN